MNVWKTMVKRSGTDEEDEKSRLQKESHLFSRMKQAPAQCQLVNSPIILEALIEGFQVRRIYVDGGSSSEVMYEHCFRNLGTEIKAKLRESRVPLVGLSGEVNYLMGAIDLNITMVELDRL
ncbi:hypothetical protein Tco_0813581 [Tanacetum coccineum]